MGLYDPASVYVTIGGVDITGYADGTFISIVPNAEGFTRIVGADGEVAFAKSNDNTYNITLTLLQTSTSNTVLSGLLTADIEANGGAFPISITDLQGNSLFFSPVARSQQAPDTEYSKEVGERAWTIITAQATVNLVGGITD